MCHGIDGVILTIGNPDHARTGTLFSMDGTLPRSAAHIFRTLQEGGNSETIIKCSCVHVCTLGERHVLRDGLSLDNAPGGISGSSEHFVGAVGDVLALRKVMLKSHESLHSLPSHTVFTMVLNKKDLSSGASQTASIRFIELSIADPMALEMLGLWVANLGSKVKDPPHSSEEPVLSELLATAIGQNSQINVLLSGSSNLSHAAETRSLLELGSRLRKVEYEVGYFTHSWH